MSVRRDWCGLRCKNGEQWSLCLVHEGPTFGLPGGNRVRRGQLNHGPDRLAPEAPGRSSDGPWHRSPNRQAGDLSDSCRGIMQFFLDCEMGKRSHRGGISLL